MNSDRLEFICQRHIYSAVSKIPRVSEKLTILTYSMIHMYSIKNHKQNDRVFFYI